eukprot:gene9854-biopygen12263
MLRWSPAGKIEGRIGKNKDHVQCRPQRGRSDRPQRDTVPTGALCATASATDATATAARTRATAHSGTQRLRLMRLRLQRARERQPTKRRRLRGGGAPAATAHSGTLWLRLMRPRLQRARERQPTDGDCEGAEHLPVHSPGKNGARMVRLESPATPHAVPPRMEPGRNCRGRVPDASRTTDFEETDTSRTRPQPLLPEWSGSKAPEAVGQEMAGTGLASLCKAGVNYCAFVIGPVPGQARWRRWAGVGGCTGGCRGAVPRQGGGRAARQGGGTGAALGRTGPGLGCRGWEMTK